MLVGHPGHDDHDARLGRQPAAHARCSAAATGQPARGRDPRRGSGRGARDRAATCSRCSRTRQASPTRSSAAKKAGRSSPIRVDRPKAALLGLTVSGVANTIRTNIGGTQAAFYRERGKEFPIIVRLREEDRDRVDSVNDVLISTPGGQVLQAQEPARPAPQTGPTQIERKNQQRIMRVNAELEAGTRSARRSKNVQARLPRVSVPQDFSVGFGAEVEQQAQAFQQLQVC